jgi:butyrate kinase
MSELKVSGYNTHDRHTMLSLYLAIAIRAVNYPYLNMVITHMCHFFNVISKKVIDVVELDEICSSDGTIACGHSGLLPVAAMPVRSSVGQQLYFFK